MPVRIFLLSTIVFFLFFVSLVKSPTDPFYTVKGIALDYSTGNPILLGNVTVVVKETGDKNTSIIRNGTWIANVSTTADYSTNRVTLGLHLNSSDSKNGYSAFTIGSGSFVSQTAACSYRPWNFTGYVIDFSTGSTQNSGNISVSVDNAPFSSFTSNSTGINNGYFSLFLNPCLISGEIYTFRFTTFVGGTVKSNMFFRTVAK